MSSEVPPTPPSPDMMNEMDSADLLMSDLVLPTQTPRWRCSGSRVRSQDSVLGQGELDRLVTGDRPVPQLKTEPSLDILGVLCGLHMTDGQVIEQLVEVLLNELNLLWMSENTTLKGVDLGDLEDRRANVADCLAFIRELGWLHGSDNELQLSDKILDCVVRPLLLHMETLSELPSHMTGQSASSNYLHTWLEVRWTILSVCYHLTPDRLTLPLVQLPLTPDPSLIYQMVTATVLDLSIILDKRVSGIDLGQHGLATNWSVFGCHCQEEFWLCLARLYSEKGLDFWSLVYTCWFETDQDNLEPDMTSLQYPGGVKRDSIVFLLFISSFVKVLHELDTSLLMSNGNKIYKILRKFLRQFLLECDEQKMRLCLQVVLFLSSTLGPNLDILDELLKSQTTSPKLNSACRLKTMSLAGSTTIPASPSTWLSLITCDTKHQTKLTSFLVFVQVVRQSVEVWQGKVESGSQAKEVKVLINRVNTKLGPKKFAELNEYGIFHLGSLLLVLSGQGGSVSSLLQLVGTGGGHQVTRLKLGLTLCLQLVETDQDVTEVTTMVSQLVGVVVVKLGQNNTDVSIKRQAQDLVKAFIEGVTEVVDQSLSLISGEDCLIQPWLATYLSICSTNEISSICASLTNVLTRTRIQLSWTEDKAQLVKMLDQLWTVVYPSLRQLATHLTVPSQVASLAADFIVQMAESGIRGGHQSKENIQQMIKYFGLSQQVNPAISVVLVARLVDSPAVLDMLERDTGNVRLLLEVVTTCCVTIPTDSPDMGQLVSAWNCLAGRLGLQVTGGDLVLDILGQMVNSQHGGQVVKVLAEECANMGRRGGKQDPQGIIRVYQVAGWLVRDCSHLLYQPGDTTFTNLIGKLITPHAAFDTSWHLPTTKKKAIESSIQDFLIGLISINNFNEDKFIRRTVTEIVQIYVGRFDPTPHHPLLPLLATPPLKIPLDKLSQVHKITSGTLTKMLQDLRSKNPSVCISLLKFCLICVARPSYNSHELLAKEMIPVLLDTVTLIDDKVVKNPASTLLLDLISKGSSIMMDQLITTYVSKQLAFNSVRVFQTLIVVGIKNPTLIKRLLTDIGAVVMRIEERRGLGKDQRLWALLDDLRTAVGISG